MTDGRGKAGSGAGDGRRLYDVSTAGVNFADTHHQ